MIKELKTPANITFFCLKCLHTIFKKRKILNLEMNKYLRYPNVYLCVHTFQNLKKNLELVQSYMFNAFNLDLSNCHQRISFKVI